MNTPNSPNLSDVFRRFFDLRLRDIHTALPAVVDTYNADTQTVDATPQVNLPVDHEDGSITYEPVPRVFNCPVVFPGAGGFRMTFPIQKGDTVLLLFAESSIDQWGNNGGVTDPQDLRRFNLSDGIALPGLHPSNAAWTKASTTGLTIGADSGPQIVFRTDSIEFGGDDQNVPSDFVSLAQKVADNLAKIQTYMAAIDSVIRVPVNEVGNGSPSVFQAALLLALTTAGQTSWPTPEDTSSAVLKAK